MNSKFNLQKYWNNRYLYNVVKPRYNCYMSSDCYYGLPWTASSTYRSTGTIDIYVTLSNPNALANCPQSARLLCLPEQQVQVQLTDVLEQSVFVWRRLDAAAHDEAADGQVIQFGDDRQGPAFRNLSKICYMVFWCWKNLFQLRCISILPNFRFVSLVVVTVGREQCDQKKIALKSCPKCKKSPNLVTLVESNRFKHNLFERILAYC